MATIARIPEFLANLAKLSDETTIANLCNRELEYLKKAYRVSYEVNDLGMYAGLPTYKRTITNYRKAITLANDKNHTALSYLKLTDNENELIRQQNENASFRNLKIDEDIWIERVIKDTDGFIQKSIELVSASSHIDNILGLAALTGRRIAEIGYYSDFELIEQSEFDQKYKVYNMHDCQGIKVLNLSKKNMYNKPERKVNAIIPILNDNPELIIESFKDLRNRKAYRDYDHFHNACNKDLSQKVKKHYSDYLGVCKSHDLRKAYARIIFDYFADMRLEALPIVYSDILVQSIPANYVKYSGS